MSQSIDHKRKSYQAHRRGNNDIEQVVAILGEDEAEDEHLFGF